MRNLFLFLVASIILSSCTSKETQEIGRYTPIDSESGIYILDTKTGLIYYSTNGYKSYCRDIITTAQKK
jgi:hypothetical protein